MGFPQGMAKPIQALAAFFVTVGGFFTSSHFRIAIWCVIAAGVIYTLGYCVGYKNKKHVKWNTMLIATTILVAAGTYATWRGLPAATAPATPTAGPVKNESHSSGDFAPAVAGSGNTVTYNANPDDQPKPKRKSRQQ
ncbi:hypothetical protein [Silvibacterium acidisoli]|uniref:hypothetical protein n=1 Tax=Acidobacteriaceae bacterium ZG23-2 TaxID=2883246 RepID=UPI00406C7233